MNQQDAREAYAMEYDVPSAVRIAAPMVHQLSENKHGIDNPVTDLNRSDNVSDLIGSEFTGTIITTDDTPKYVKIADVTTNRSAFFFAKVAARDPLDGKFGGFIRTGSFKDLAGTVTVIDMQQDMYTMRDVSTWDVDYYISGTGVYLRVWGKASQTIYWSFSVLIARY